MSPTIVILIIAFILGAAWIVRKRNESKEYERVIREMPVKGEGWIELADGAFQPVMYGKALYSFDQKVMGVGVLVREHLPSLLASDIDEKIRPQRIGEWPVCRFLIDCGGEVIVTELQEGDVREKLKPYIADPSPIKLKIGLTSHDFILVDNEEGERDFERLWEEVSLHK